MEYILKNEKITVRISDLGAEVISILNERGEEIIHQGSEIYKSHCPICFPIIGCFPEDIYSYRGDDYRLAIHGFAKNTLFGAEQRSETEISFKTSSNPETLSVYPFEFEFTVNYKIEDNALVTEYAVENPGKDKVYYSVGTHTGYKLDQGLCGYRIRFAEALDNAKIKLLPKTYAFTKDELIKDGVIDLEDGLFKKGCFTLGNIANRSLTLEDGDGNKIVRVDYPDFDYMTVWSAPGEKYVCLEPWSCESGHYADDNVLEKQRGITEIPAGKTHKCKHTYTIY